MPNLPILGAGYGNQNMIPVEPKSIYGYQIRKPFAGEDKFFKGRPEVGGMAAEDGKIILNPYSSLKEEEKMQVAKNEAIRLWMRDNKTEIPFNITKEQSKAFSGTEYGNNPQALKETIVARVLTGDQSSMATPEQQSFANKIMEKITQSTQKPTISQSIMSAMDIKNKPMK
jgi:hypothetical protein